MIKFSLKPFSNRILNLKVMKINIFISQFSKLLFITVLLSIVSFAQNNFSKETKEEKLKKAQKIIQKAINKLGGDTYRNIQTLIGEGKFSLLKGGQVVSYQTFVDVMVFPNKERTDFIERGSKTVQVNIGEKGWFYDESIDKFADQNEIQINNFKNSLRSHYNYLLRGDWKGNADLSYVGKRRAGLGVRNDVLKLIFKDGFEVEYEFSKDGLPKKTIYTSLTASRKPRKEETRYAQFILENGIFTPFIVDHYTDDEHVFRVNYQSMLYNKSISNKIFVKPENPKKLRKKLKF